MVQRRWQCLLIFSVLVLVSVGCAKKPATLSAAAPPAPAPLMAPAPPPAVTPTPPAPEPPRAAAPAPQAPAAPIPPPPPRDFAAHDALKDIHFDFDKYDIRPGDSKILEENARWLKVNENYLILIEGHCDERGTNEYNLALGDRRTKSTLNYLVSLGIRASRISVISYGEERPLCTEKNEECWWKNRRSHFLVKAQ